VYASRVDFYQHFAVISYRDLQFMNIDVVGSAECLVTLRLHIRSSEDANVRTNKPFISHAILRVTDSKGFRYQYFACTSNCTSFFVMSFCGTLSNSLWP
jgi:hypothetical protein